MPSSQVTCSVFCVHLICFRFFFVLFPQNALNEQYKQQNDSLEKEKVKLNNTKARMNRSKSALNTPMSDGLNLKQPIGGGNNNQNLLISHSAW